MYTSEEGGQRLIRTRSAEERRRAAAARREAARAEAEQRVLTGELYPLCKASSWHVFRRTT